jgi:DNA polymerase-3 subunit delta
MELSAEEVATDPARLADELAAMSLMAPKRAILVREADDAVLDAAISALELRNPSNFLILYANDSLSKTKLRDWAERSAAIAAVPCYKDEGLNLEALIRDTLRGYGLSANSDVVRALASLLNGDRQIILNELEKLSLYMGDEAEEITLDDALAVVGENNDKSLDDFCNAVASGDMVGICRLSDRLQAEGHVGVVLTRTLLRYFNRLEQLSTARANGQTLDAAIESLRPPVFFKAKAQLKSHAMRWNATAIADAVARLQLLELDSKRYSDQSLSRMAQGFMQIAALPGLVRKTA